MSKSSGPTTCIHRLLMPVIIQMQTYLMILFFTCWAFAYSLSDCPGNTYEVEIVYNRDGCQAVCNLNSGCESISFDVDRSLSAWCCLKFEDDIIPDNVRTSDDDDLYNDYYVTPLSSYIAVGVVMVILMIVIPIAMYYRSKRSGVNYQQQGIIIIPQSSHTSTPGAPLPYSQAPPSYTDVVTNYTAYPVPNRSATYPTPSLPYQQNAQPSPYPELAQASPYLQNTQPPPYPQNTQLPSYPQNTQSQSPLTTPNAYLASASQNSQAVLHTQSFHPDTCSQASQITQGPAQTDTSSPQQQTQPSENT